jgi:outer membrane protein TolC
MTTPRRRTSTRTTLALLLLAATAAAGPVGAQMPPAPTGETGRPDPFAPLITEAIRRNLALRQQRLAAERGDAAVRQARGRFLPSLALDPRYSESDNALALGELVNPAYRTLNQLTGTRRFPTDIDATLPLTQETKLRLVQPLYQPAIRAAYDATRSARDAQEAELRAAARQLAADVQLAYLDVARAGRIVELHASTGRLLEENLRVNERLLEAGKVTVERVHRARADLRETEQQHAQAVHERDAAVRTLNLLLGRALEAPAPAIADSLLSPPLDITLDEALGLARSRREELRQLDHARRAAEGEVRLAAASFLPGVSLAVDYGVQGSDYRFGAPHDVTVASIVLQWNLFNGGQDAARREQAALEADRVRAQRQDLERRIELQVRRAHDATVVARRAIATAGERLAAARRTFELVSRRYEAGAASQIEFVDARVAYTNAELNEILTRYAYAARYVELERVAALRSIEL